MSFTILNNNYILFIVLYLCFFLKYKKIGDWSVSYGILLAATWRATGHWRVKLYQLCCCS